MVINFVEIIAVEIIQPLKVTSISPTQPQWEFEHDFEIGTNSNSEIIQNLTMEIVRRKNSKQAIIKTRTSFRLTLATNEIAPTTDEDFTFYTLFTQTALSHSRVLFQRETRGTMFDKDILLLFPNKDIERRLRLYPFMGLN